MPIAKTHLVNLDRPSRIAATEIQHVVPGDLVEIVGTSQHEVVALRLIESDRVVGPFAVVPDASGHGWTTRIDATQLLADGDFREWVVELQDKVTDPLPTATAVYRTESQSSVWRRAGFLKVANRRVTKASWGILPIGGVLGLTWLSIVLPQWSAHSVGARIVECLLIAIGVVPLAWRLSIRKSIRGLRVAFRASIGCSALLLAAQFFAGDSTVYIHVRAQSSIAQVHFGTALSRRTFTRFELDRLRPALLAANTDVIAVTQADRCETIGDGVELGSNMFLLVCRNRWLHVRPVRRRELGI